MVDPLGDTRLFEFEQAPDFISQEYVEEYLEMYSDLTIVSPSKFYTALINELTLHRRAEFISAEDLGEGRQVKYKTKSHVPFSTRKTCLFQS